MQRRCCKLATTENFCEQSYALTGGLGQQAEYFRAEENCIESSRDAAGCRRRAVELDEVDLSAPGNASLSDDPHFRKTEAALVEDRVRASQLERLPRLSGRVRPDLAPRPPAADTAPIGVRLSDRVRSA